MKRLLNRKNLAFWGFFLIAGYFLWAEHAAHLKLAIPYIPFLLLAACPLLHLFMHGGHGHGGHGHGGHGHGGHGHHSADDREGAGNDHSLKGGLESESIIPPISRKKDSPHE